VALALRPDDLLDLARGRPLGPCLAWADGPELRQAAGIGPEQDDEAAWSVVLFASVDGLIRHGLRLVATAEADFSWAGADRDSGQVTVQRLLWSQLTAVYADDPAQADAVAELVPTLAGVDFEQAWSEPALTAFLARADLLWYDPSEVSRGLVTVVGPHGARPLV
jgi:hypothetical protein